MKKVITSIQYGDRGEAVVHLHQALEVRGFPIREEKQSGPGRRAL